MQIRRPILQKKELKKEIPKQEQVKFANQKVGFSSQSKISPLQYQLQQTKQSSMDLKYSKPNSQNMQIKFKQIFEQCGDEIISYLTQKEQTNLKAVNRITFYMVQSYQVWDMIVFDNDQISVATTNDTNEKESFLKSSFYSKVGKSRPSTRENEDSEQWFVKPLTYNSSQNQLVFLKNKNKIEDNIISDDELKQTITIWTLNLTNLQKCINISKVQTDSFMQEISLWIDQIKLLQDFKKEYSLDHVSKILKLLQQKSIIDVSFERKKKVFEDLISSLLCDFDLKQLYAQELVHLKPICQRLINIKLADFNNELQENLWQQVEKIQTSFEQTFNIRKEYFLMKLFVLVQKVFQINLSWITDLQNFEMTLGLLGQFSFFVDQIQARHNFGEKKFSQNQTLHAQNEVYYCNYKKGIDDMIKMLKLNKKLLDTSKENLQAQQMLQEYKNLQFDQFQNKQQWSQIYKSWKEKYKNSKTKQEEPEQSEGISFGFFQTRMNWSIQ